MSPESNHSEVPSFSPLLHLDAVGLSAGYDGDWQLDDVNWEVQEGQFWLLLGLHHAGKSNLLSAICGLVPYQEGRLEVMGKVLPCATESEWRELRGQVGMVFEKGGRLLSDHSALENVLLPVCYHRDCSGGQAMQLVQPWLEWAELEEWLHASAARLSAAWATRVALVRALVLRPQLLLVDDPLRGLDPEHREWWIQSLGKLHRGDCPGGRPHTLIVSTDDLRPWEALGGMVQVAQVQNRKFRLIDDGPWDGVD